MNIYNCLFGQKPDAMQVTHHQNDFIRAQYVCMTPALSLDVMHSLEEIGSNVS